jgi:hypothetical protein
MTQATLNFDAPRQAQIAAVAAKAESQGFDSTAAEAAVLAYLTTGESSAENIVAACKRAGHVPHDDRAFGKIFASLSRRGVIVKAGSTPRYNGNPCWIWRLA